MSYETLKDETLESMGVELIAPSSSIEWEVPILFSEFETPDIPATLLPDIFGEFASSLSEATETPSALSVITILSSIACASSRYFRVQPISGGDWLEPINIYTIVTLPPANNKTQILNACCKPLVEWEKEQAEVLKTQIDRQRSERKTQEKIIDALRNKVAREEDLNVQRDLMRVVAQKESELIEPEVLPKLFANDITTESLTTVVCEQSGYFGIFSDEGGILEVLSGLYNGGNANIDILLKGIDGGYIRVKRKDKSIDINPLLTIALIAQPVVLQNMGVKKSFMGNGFLERFLYVLPKSKLGYRTHNNPPVPLNISIAYGQRIKSLLNLSPLAHQPYLLTLSHDAYQEWREFRHHIELQLRPDGKLSPCQGWGGKVCGFALRIAGLLHVGECSNRSLIINKSTMEKALELIVLLTQHAVAAFGLMGIEEATQDAKEIYRWIISKKKASFTKTEITSVMKNRKIDKPDRLSKGLNTLEDRNIIYAVILPTRKPTTLFHVNPAILKEV